LPLNSSVPGICIYTDGGCSGNPGPGGWAYVIIRIEDSQNQEEGIDNSVLIAENWGAEKSTTNNRMELMAAISALEYLPAMQPPVEKATLYTDSQYLQKGMTVWIKDWKSKGWKTSGKSQVKNQDLWQRLDSLASGFTITWAWVKGHAGNKYNEHCDVLTQKAIASLQ